MNKEKKQIVIFQTHITFEGQTYFQDIFDHDIIDYIGKSWDNLDNDEKEEVKHYFNH